MKYNNPHMSEHSPRFGNGFTSAVGSTLLKLSGWKLVGKMPDVPKFVIIGVPHTSNWDAFAATFAMLAAGFRYSFLVKKEWFFWPMGPLLRWLGGYPIDRGKGTNVVEQLAEYIEKTDRVCIGIPPEGTRTKVGKYKTGYLRLAYAANVPVFICGFDGPGKRVVLDQIMTLTGDLKKDNAAIRNYVDENFVGIHPERQ